jgi:hypothetical protein
VDNDEKDYSQRFFKTAVPVLALVALLIMLVLTGTLRCTPWKSEVDAEQPAAPAEQAPVAAPENEGEYGAGAWDISGVETDYEDQTHGMAAEPGQDIQSTSFYAYNSSDTPLELHNDDFTMKGKSGATYELIAPENQGFNGESGPVKPKYSYTMRLGYSVPETETGFTLYFSPQEGGNGETAEIPIAGK